MQTLKYKHDNYNILGVVMLDRSQQACFLLLPSMCKMSRPITLQLLQQFSRKQNKSTKEGPVSKTESLCFDAFSSLSRRCKFSLASGVRDFATLHSPLCRGTNMISDDVAAIPYMGIPYIMNEV